ncbi:MAG: hypothetical protein LBQ39_10500 [Tannerellaceae bacterium]|jgi:hypothetical protein|nr:hypothetical protein [Tannerellaceae bacterium]
MILEYEKEEWKEKSFYVILSMIGVEGVLWIVFASLDIEKAFLASLLLTALLAVALTILYLLARLLYRGFLILTGQEWKSAHVGWALTGVRKTRRQDKLKKIALNAAFWGVRIEAVSRISDQKFLKKVVLKDANGYVRDAAWKEISSFDQDFLKEVIT